MSKDLQELYELGLSLLQQRKLAEAESAYRQVLQLDPQHVGAWNDLGVALWMQGKLEECYDCYRRALEMQPDFVDSYLNWGVAVFDQGRLEDALYLYQKVLEIDPGNAKAHNNIGILLQRQNRLEEAISLFCKAVELKPDFAQAYFNLGTALNENGKFDEAISSYRRAIALDPNNPESYLNAGVATTGIARVVHDASKLDDAVHWYLKALELKPDYVDAHFNKGLVHAVKRELEDAAGSFRRAIELNPEHVEAHVQLGWVLKEQDQVEDSIAANRRALELSVANLDPNSPVWELGTLLYELDRLPIVYKDEADIQTHRAQYASCLERALSLVSSVETTLSAEERAILKGIVFQKTNFYLAYQQMNDVEFQVACSKLAAAILRPELNEYLTASKVSRPKTKIRLGIASEYLGNHNGAFWAYGWLSNFPREDYEFFLYSLHGLTDGVTQQFAELGTYRWLPFRERNYLDSLQTIRDDNLDVLLLPDVGMSLSSKIISLARLAPIQCVGWGHPMTTGSPNIDYYLSCELMETDEADGHYSEQLIRLPNIGICIENFKQPVEALSRSDFGIPDNKIVFGSVQSVYKYLPQFDFVYPAIAKQVPDAFFVFVGSQSQSVTDKFRDRLKDAFEQSGLNFEQYAIVLPRLTYTRFMQLLGVIDVNLDTIGWTGAITTINSLIRGCPVVTVPGEFMRGRHSFAILKRIGVEELIANSLDEYISLAARVGSDRDLRSSIVQKIEDQTHRLFEDKECVEYLDAFFKEKVAALRANSPPPISEFRQFELPHANGSSPFVFRASSSDEVVMQQVWANQEYSLTRLRLNPAIEEFLADNAKKGVRPLILDLGANIGASAAWFVQNYPEARVIAVEPDPGNHELLVHNTKNFDCIAVKGAIASEKGHAHVQDPGLGYFGLRAEIDPSGSTETFTVPELIEQYGGNAFFPFIAKIDIEGGEAELFSKNSEWIDRFPILIVELHDWLLPNTNTSRNFLTCMANRERDFVYIGENIFSIRTPLCAGGSVGGPVVSTHVQPTGCPAPMPSYESLQITNAL